MTDHVHDLDGLAIGMASNSLARQTVSAAAREIERLRRCEDSLIQENNRMKLHLVAIDGMCARLEAEGVLLPVHRDIQLHVLKALTRR